MSINRPDGAFTVEFLLKENAKLRKRVVEMDRHNVDLANTVGPMSKENADLKKQLADLKEVCSRLEDEKEIILKHVPDTHLRVAIEELVAHSEDFNGAEYFAGR